jgi:cobalt/nickel transport system permease protein
LPPASGLPGAEIARRARQNQLVAPSLVAIFALALPLPARAMHLADGTLPLGWAALFTGLAAPFVAIALGLLRLRGETDFRLKPLLAMVAAAVFLLSAMPIPVPFVGTCSHPCGTGLAAILIGPWMTVVVALVALLLQALFLGHGGFTTLGADLLSMGIAGGFAGWLAFRLFRRGGASLAVAAFAGGLLSDWCTYAVTAGELAVAVHGARPIAQVFGTVALAFVPVQLPLGLLEAALTAGAVTFVARRRPDLLQRLAIDPAGSAP